ncbi:MAG: replication initiation protein, partial [Burkholderiaceae bacterium]
VQLPKRLEDGIRNRIAFSELNLMVVRRMRTTPAVMLYRLCAYYATNPSRLTNRAAPAEWYGKVTGKPLPENFQMKVFKRDVLLPAIAEVNAVTDIHIELITHRRGRVIETIQFKVHHIDEYREHVVTDQNAELTRNLLSLGLKVREAATMIRQYSADRIQRNLTYTLTRNAAMGGDMKNASAYFKSAVKKDYAGATANPVLSTESPEDKLSRLRDEFQKTRTEAAEKKLAALPADEQSATWIEFVETIRAEGDAVMLKRLETKPDSALVKARFRNWYAVKSFGTVTDDAFALFLAQRVQ